MSYEISRDKVVPLLAKCLVKHGSMEAIHEYVENYEKMVGGDATVCPEFIATYEVSQMPDKEARIAEAKSIAAKQIEEEITEEMPDHSMDGVKTGWWRWPLVPIGSIAGACLAAFLVSALQWVMIKTEGRFSDDGWWLRFVQPFMVAGVFGYAWSTLAFSIAPKGKLIAGVVMTTILGMLWALAIFMIVNEGEDVISVTDKVQVTIGFITSIIAAVCGLVSKNSEG